MFDRDLYQSNGFAIVRGHIDNSKVRQIRQEAERLWAAATADLDSGDLHWRNNLAGERRPDRIDRPSLVSPALHELIAGEDMLGLAGAAFGEPAALFKDKLIMKTPGAHGYTLHQDFPYWESIGVPAEALLSVYIALDPADPSNGVTEFCPGHHGGRLPGAPGDPLDTDPASLAGAEWTAPELAPGDAVIFHSLTPHRSGVNTTDRHRRSYFVSYLAARHTHLIDGRSELLPPEVYGQLRRQAVSADAPRRSS